MFVIIINVLQYFFNFSFHGSIQAILMSVIRLRKLDPKIEFETHCCLFVCFCFCLFTMLSYSSVFSYQNEKVFVCLHVSYI